MAFTEFYCNFSTGSNMNGGSDAGTSPSYAATNGGWNSGTGVFTPTSGDPSASVTVGQYASVFLDGATTPVFIGRVTAVSSTTVTVSTTLKSGTAPTTAGTGLSINVGGVWKGVNGADGFPLNLIVPAMRNDDSSPTRVNWKNNATYDITAQIVGASISGPIVHEGYTTTVGDGGVAKIDGGGTGTRYVFANLTTQLGAEYRNFWFTRNGGSSTGQNLVNASSQTVFRNCRFSHSSLNGLTSGNAYGCESYSNTVAGFAGVTSAEFCISHSNTTIGYEVLNYPQSPIKNCIAHNNGTVGFYIRSTAARHGEIVNCDAYENTSHGFEIRRDSSATNQGVRLVNCNSVKNGGYGVAISNSGTNAGISLENVGLGAGTMANTSGGIQSTTSLILLDTSFSYPANESPWVDPDNGDFRINHADAKNAGVGDFLQASGLYSGGTIGYPDIGAAQHLDAAGASVKGLRVMGG